MMSEPLDLSGRAVRLRTTTSDDRDRLVAIRRTDEVFRRWGGDDLDAELSDDLDDHSTHQLTIEDSEGVIVGMIQFHEEDDPQYRSASIDLYVDPSHHRRGYASDAIRALTDHLFDQRGHHRITIDPAADNVAAIECYRRVGFRPVGVLRAYELQSDGTWADGLLLDLLASDRPGVPPGDDRDPPIRSGATGAPRR